MIKTIQIKTPLGKMIAGATDDGICLFDFEYRKMMPKIKDRITSYLKVDFVEGRHTHFDVLETQLQEYFLGSRKGFDLPLLFTGTSFQNKVWNALMHIPYGKTRSYLEQSKVLGDEKAIRAVAKANGENCLAIIVPCHRVLGSDGSLTGYAGGLNNKKLLLEHEAKHSGATIQTSMF